MSHLEELPLLCRHMGTSTAWISARQSRHKKAFIGVIQCHFVCFNIPVTFNVPVTFSSLGLVCKKLMHAWIKSWITYSQLLNTMTHLINGYLNQADAMMQLSDWQVRRIGSWLSMWNLRTGNLSMDNLRKGVPDHERSGMCWIAVFSECQETQWLTNWRRNKRTETKHQPTTWQTCPRRCEVTASYRKGVFLA